MKYLFCCFFLLIAPYVVGQNSWDSLGALPKATPIQTILPYDSLDKFEDLAFLKEVLKDKRVVMLGESMHGVEDFNEAKTRIIKFLHQEMGFEVIAFESELSACELANQKKQSWVIANLLKYALYPIWHTPACWELMDYAKKTPDLQLTGFDMQPQFFEDSTCVLAAFVKDKYPFLTRKILWAEKEVGNSWKSPSLRGELKKIYQKYLRKLKKNTQIVRNNSKHTVKLIRRIAEDRITMLARYALIQRDLKLSNNVRDSMMAENIDWLLEEYYPDKKVIIWAHNSHISKNGSANGHTCMGKVLQEKWSEESYVMGFYYAVGSVCHMPNSIRYENTPKSIKGKSIQHMIYQLNVPWGFIDFKTQQSNKWLNSLLHNVCKPFLLFDEESRIRLIDSYDGIFMCRNARCPDYLKEIQ